MNRFWLREIRESKRFTGKSIANEVGISESLYSLIESGKRGKPLNPAIAKKIANILGFDWTLFYENEVNSNKED